MAGRSLRLGSCLLGDASGLGRSAFSAGLFLPVVLSRPERTVPQQPGAVVSPADGKVTDVSALTDGGEKRTRISIFLSVFDVHVNRSPIAGTIRDVRYQRGKFLDARSPLCAEQNEQNIVTVEGDRQAVVFKQIAGLLARRIVFYPRLEIAWSVANGSV